jgi:hypothetical protein
MLPNERTRMNKQTVQLLMNRAVLLQVADGLQMGASKRSIADMLGLNWRQINVVVKYLLAKGGVRMT